ncbi:MAG: hypothetical protein R3D67_05890 [Hyphomicrobiaceae bacterium]
MILAARGDRELIVTAGAAAFAFAVSVVAVLSNFETWRLPSIATPRGYAVRSFVAMRTNTALAAIAYGWGAAAMLGLYLTPLTGLKWQHGWQYGSAMALLAGLCFAFIRTLPLPGWGRRAGDGQWHALLARPLSIAQAAISAGGLGALALSGKLASVRADWAANRVFAALAISILAVSIASLVSLARARHD